MAHEGTVVTGGGRGQGSGWNRDVVQETNVIAPRDLVRWGPIWAGLLTALGLFLLLSMLALAIGLNNVNVGAGQADEAAASSGIVSAIIALVSFAIGGFIASRSAAVGGSGAGALNGFLVWALGLLLILALAAFGLGQLFGAAGDLFGQVRGTGLGTGGTDVNPTEVQQGVRDAAIPALLGLALPAAAATIGGFLGARRDRWANETTAETAR
jgi:hypothetical protein